MLARRESNSVTHFKSYQGTFPMCRTKNIGLCVFSSQKKLSKWAWLSSSHHKNNSGSAASMGKGEWGRSRTAGSPDVKGPLCEMLSVKPERKVKLHCTKVSTSGWLCKYQWWNYEKQLWHPKSSRRKYRCAVETYVLLINDQGPISASL